MTQKNFDCLTQNAEYAENFVDESKELEKAGLLTLENFGNTQHIVNLVSGFFILTDGGRFIVVQDNREALIKALIENAEYARELATGFHTLREADIWGRDSPQSPHDDAKKLRCLHPKCAARQGS